MPRLFLDVIAAPASGKQCIMLDKKKRIKIFLKNSPENGKANQELIRLLSEKSRIPQKQFEIVRGLTDRKKRIAITTDISLDLLLEQLGIENQISFL